MTNSNEYVSWKMGYYFVKKWIGFISKKDIPKWPQGYSQWKSQNAEKYKSNNDYGNSSHLLKEH